MKRANSPWSDLSDFLVPAFAITMLATIVLDLTRAILIGSLLAGAAFLNKIARIDVNVQEVDNERFRLHERLHRQGGTLMVAGVRDNTGDMMEAADSFRRSARKTSAGPAIRRSSRRNGGVVDSVSDA